MSELPVVSVRGTAVMEVQPELARLSVHVRAEDKDRAAALQRLNERGQALDATLKRFGDAIERVTTQGVHVSPVWKDAKARERVAGYAATLVKEVTVVDFTRLGELVGQLADLELATVDGPWWTLRPDSPVRREARVAAVGDAVRQARDYAAALGSELAELTELADTGLLDRGPQSADFAAPRALAAAGPPTQLTFDIEPQPQTVRASVEARFRITVPDLSRA